MGTANVSASDEPTDFGEITFNTVCSSCHQQSGHGIKGMAAPAIAGLPRWYISDQLRKFRAGTRGGSKADGQAYLMHLNVSRLTDKQVAFVGRYVQSLPPLMNRVTETIDENQLASMLDPTQTPALYEDACGLCHGKTGLGNRKTWGPPLNRRQDWYLAAQLKQFELGKRPHDKRGRLKALSESEQLSLAHYIATFEEKN